MGKLETDEAVNPQDVAKYIGVMLVPLQKLARERKLDVLAYLIGLAREEAAIKSTPSKKIKN